MYDYWGGDWQHGVDGNELVVRLKIGDNFTVNVKERNMKAKTFRSFVAQSFCI